MITLQFTVLAIAVLFLLLMMYYGALTVWGLSYRRWSARQHRPAPADWPSVDILIPAHNEGKVLANTLDAMVRQNYAGHLEIYVLNDSSQDDTADIAEAYDTVFTSVHHIRVPEGTPRGKARVLNHGFALSTSEYVAVYDADNAPEPDALRLLVQAAVTTPHAVGAVGYVKTANEKRNWLTRMIALEFALFQLLMQAGRWHMGRLGSLTGTNIIIRREALADVGAWDPHALAEDADLTMKLTAAGGLLPVVPESRTWEQEPESFGVWLRQRTRWMQGNLYLVAKLIRTPQWWTGRTLWHSLQLVSVYSVFILFLLLSDALFIGGLLGLVHVYVAVPLVALWTESIVIYMLQIVSAVTVDGMLDAENLALAFIMYVSYAQLWIVILIIGYVKQAALRARNAEVVWDKTVRF